MLFDPTSAVNALWLHATEEAARALRVSLMPTGVRSMEDFEHALAVCNRGTRFVYNAERAAFGAASNHFREQEGWIMSDEGPAFYDNERVFQTYLQHRHRPDNPNDTLEKPVLLELLGAVRGTSILDLGCGEAALGKELLAQGAVTYLGLDGSRNMVACATHTLEGTAGSVLQADICMWVYPVQTFDRVISRLALHYIDDIAYVFQAVFQALRPGGRFVFSVEHPIITSCDRAYQAGSVRQGWIVDDYFAMGPRMTHWLGGQVIKYHRTVEAYFGGLQHAGFVVESVRESQPQRQQFSQEETYRRRQRIPLFLFFAARKPSGSV